MTIPQSPDEALESWLRTRNPPVPEPFLDWLLEEGGGGGPAEGPWSRGIAALDDALRSPGRVRSSAFHLLAADAWITYACEEAAQEGDTRGLLADLLHHLGDRFS